MLNFDDINIEITFNCDQSKVNKKTTSEIYGIDPTQDSIDIQAFLRKIRFYEEYTYGTVQNCRTAITKVDINYPISLQDEKQKDEITLTSPLSREAFEASLATEVEVPAFTELREKLQAKVSEYHALYKKNFLIYLQKIPFQNGLILN